MLEPKYADDKFEMIDGCRIQDALRKSESGHQHHDVPNFKLVYSKRWKSF